MPYKNAHYPAAVLLCIAALAGARPAKAQMTADRNPVPAIALPLVPTAITPGSGTFTLTVNGNGFVTGSTVQWNGSPRNTVLMSGTQLTASILASDVLNPSTAWVTVVNPSPGGGRSNLAFLSVTAATSSVYFSGPSFQAGNQPLSPVVADFNGDGNLDMAVVNEMDDTVSVFLGNGDGTFQARVPYPVGRAPVFVLAGDFNGDGRPDLVVVNAGDNTISVLLGQGDGTFQKAITFSPTLPPLFIRSGDFNGDGNLDLAVSTAFANSISVLLGNGDGTFQNAIVTDIPAGAGDLAVGDLNHDGKLDVVIASSGLDTLLGNGDGTFQSPLITPASPFRIAVADMNGDGNLDVIYTGGPSTPSVTVLLGRGDGSFGSGFSSSTPVSPIYLLVADLNGDGIPDVAIGTDDGLSTLLGNGDGSLQPHSESNVPNSANSTPLVAGDFNQDGRIDLIVVNGDNNMINSLLQTHAVVVPISLSLGVVPVGRSSQPMPVTLSNNGTAALAFSTPTFSGTNPTDYSETNNCGTSLAGGSNCTITVTFTPGAAGSRTAILDINDSAVGSPQPVTLTGFGATPTAVLSPSTLTYGVQLVDTASPFKSAILTNIGSATLTLSSITFSGDFFEENKCGSSLAPGANCTIKVRFRPTAGGTRTGVITVTDDAMGSPQTITLTGTGTVVELSSTFVNFGSQAINTTSPPMTVTLTNVGFQALTISGISIGGGAAHGFAQTNNCGASVTAGGSCTFSITFSPTKKTVYQAALQIRDSGGASPQKITLFGIGN
jgi:FG-GAP-like repeat/Abnormal spindle-like microcephaly-assoc'd, ASPM-SPD-2-Hydin